MHVARFFRARLARENSGQGRFALGQAIEGGDDVVESFEVIHAVGAAAKFAGSLRASAENATRFQDQVLGDPEGADRYINTEWAPERVIARYHWLFEYDATATPV